MAKFLQEAALSRKRARSAEDEEEVTSIVPKENKSKLTTGVISKKKLDLESSDTIYLGHIPHGFYEKEMRSFFDQFGKIVKLKLFRSSKTNNSKGYAFIQFENDETAKIVSETMDGYFIHERKLVSNIIPKSKCHEGMFKRPKKTDNVSDDVIDAEDEGKQDVSVEKKAKALKKSLRGKQQKLAQLGIDFDVLSALTS